MRKAYKILIAVFVIITVSLTCSYQESKDAYAGNLHKYLVLVQQKGGSWKEYRNLIEISGNGSLMVKAKLLSKALGFHYKNSVRTFAIQSSSARYNTYIKNSRKFIYTEKSARTIKSALNIACKSKRSKNNICQVNTLSTLVNYKYYTKAKAKNYPNYSGVVCFSKYKQIPASAPKAKQASTAKSTPTPEPEPSTINIEGVKFPVRDKFLSVKEALSDWGGAAITWNKLEQEVDGKIIKSTDLYVGSKTIMFTHLGADSDGVYLSKTRKGYKLSISVKLTGSVLNNQNASIVKAMIVTISSRPSLVYKAIFDSFTTTKTHGINKKTYVTIGDCKIKIEIKSGKVIYYIKGASI